MRVRNVSSYTGAKQTFGRPAALQTSFTPSAIDGSIRYEDAKSFTTGDSYEDQHWDP